MIMVARQKIALGRNYAGQVLTIDVAVEVITIDLSARRYYPVDHNA